jgi:phosphoribosylglycinamide formyltransferase-1
MRRIVVLISGRGSNLEAILTAARQEHWDHRIVGVIADRVDAQGLSVARQAGIDSAVIAFRDYPGRSGFELALLQQIERFAADLVVLAGFMRVLGDDIVARFQGRLINIHPSLLPAFPGLHTHRRALEAGVRVHGATVHLATPVLDQGPILAQSIVPVRSGDTSETLAIRVLETEHQILPRALRWLADGRVKLHQGSTGCQVEIEGVSAQERLLVMDY